MKVNSAQTIESHLCPSHWRAQSISVVLAGCGGTGAQVLHHLARIHASLLRLGHPGGLSVDVVDPDMVSEANIGRQPFSPYDVGRPKAEVLVTRLNQFYGSRWQAEICPVRQSRIGYNRVDLIIGCVDSRSARRELMQWADRRGVRYWLDCGNSAQSGQVIVGELKGIFKQDQKRLNLVRLSHAADLFPEMVDTKVKEDNQPSCSVADSLFHQDLFINSTMANYAGHLLWSLIRQGTIRQHGYFVNLETGRTSALPVNPDHWKRINPKLRLNSVQDRPSKGVIEKTT